MIRLLAFVAAVALLTSCGPKRVAQAVPDDELVLRVMTYNVNYGLAGDDATIEAIVSRDVDVVFLQETTPAWEKVLRERFADEFEQMAFVHCCGAGGLAVLSRVPFEDGGVLEPPEDGWFPAWRVVLDTAVGKVQALNVHLRPPFSDGGSVAVGYFTTKKVREAEITAYFEQLDSELPTIVTGDFNEDQNGRAVSFLRARGMESALPEFDRSADTWRWRTSVGGVSSTLDHVVYDDRLEPLNAEVVDVGRSDHLPVVVTLRRSDAQPAAN